MLRLFALLSVAGIAAVLGVAACDEAGGTGGAGGHGGAGGEGGCPTEPTANFTLTITAADGPLPPDTSLKVTWSAGEEPELLLSDPSTYPTLDEAGVVCDLDASAPPPTDLKALVCRLWTSGPTEVLVKAMGYVDHEETFTPEQSDLCGGPIPTAVAVELEPLVDAGAR